MAGQAGKVKHGRAALWHNRAFRTGSAAIRLSTHRPGTARGRGMSQNVPLAPEECQTMADVRNAVDAVDADLVRLLARRFGYMRAAARIKPERGLVRDEARKAEVIANAAALAEELGLPAAVIADVWERLVEGSIAYELDVWDAGQG